MSKDVVMDGVRENNEGSEVYLNEDFEVGKDFEQTTNKRLYITAINEGGYNSTCVDLLDVIEWVKKNKPELLQ